jgi:hypothetical protein
MMSVCTFDELVSRVAAMLRDGVSQKDIDRFLNLLSPAYRADVLSSAEALIERTYTNPNRWVQASALLFTPNQERAMDRGHADRGVRTAASGVDVSVPMVDTAAGDEGIDDGVRGDPGKPQTSPKEPAKSRDVDPENMGEDPLEDLVEDPPDKTATPPGPTFKDGRRR